MTITQFNLLSFKPVVPLFSIYYSFLNIRPPKLVIKRLSGRTYIYIYISRKTLRSLRPEIGEFAGRAGEDRAVEDRAGEDMAGQGRAGGHIKSGQSKSRAGRGQKAGQGMMGILQYE